MASQPAPGAAPTGNALTQAQADAAAAAAGQQVISALESLGSASAQPQGSECLWPPPASWGIGVGPVKFSLGMPCLITRSEARAVIGAGLVVAGLLVVAIGMQILIETDILIPIALRAVGMRAGGGKAGKGAGAAAEGASAPAASEVALAA